MSRILNLSTFVTLQKTVTVSGTPVQLDAYTLPDGITCTIKADDRNTGIVCVGNSSANALNTANAGFRLTANSSIDLALKSTDAVWIDSTQSGDVVDVIFEY